MDYSTLPIYKTTQVAVLGGGLAGCAAAVAAARNGAKTLLVESGGCLGGAATAGLVAPISSVYTKSCKQKFGGILWELLDRVRPYAEKYCRADGYPVTALHIYKYVLLQLLKESGAEILFHAFLADVVNKPNGEIDYLVVATKAGLQRVQAAVYIDTTGDGDVIGKTAANCIIGSEPGVLGNLVDDKGQMHTDTPFEVKKDDYVGQLQPVSLMMLFGDVDLETGKKYMNKQLTYADLNLTKEQFKGWQFCGTTGFEPDDSERVPMPQGRVWLCQGPRKNTAIINMSRIIHVNACDPQSYSNAEVEAGLQLIAIIDFLQSFVPGFQNAYMIESSSSLGVRESRRLIGDYVLTGRDVISCRTFADSVAYGSYIIDIHDPCGKRMAIGGEVQKDYYAIPYRCLITAKVPNLGTAGRSISADHVATSSTRIQGTAMLTGQAIGTAAALAVQAGCTLPQVSAEKLRAQLKADGAFIH